MKYSEKMKHELFYRWVTFRNCCTNENNYSYKYYGARGIDYDPSWDDFEKFVHDVESTIGKLPSKKAQFDRIDNDKGFWINNIRWSTAKENHNNRRNNHKVTWNGQTKSVSEWQDITGINEATILSRLLDYGWTVEEALTIKPYRKKRHK